MTVRQAERYIQDGHFAAGSMLPKVKASLEFVEATGNFAVITNPESIERALDRQTGTWIVRGGRKDRTVGSGWGSGLAAVGHRQRGRN
jgi:carbamate kinase